MDYTFLLVEASLILSSMIFGSLIGFFVADSRNNKED